jgi:pSer/pThr/pTyr-binding forkhead associated (FHA) protein
MDATPPISELIGLTGRQKGKRYALDKTLIKIGRDESCDLRILVDAIQPIHALLICTGEGAVLSAWEGSEVFVNGNRIEHEQLRDKSILRIGPFQFQLRLHTISPSTLKIRHDDEQDVAPPPLPAESSSDSVEERRVQLEALHRQLRESRANFREEQRRKETEIEQQFQDLSEAFDEADRREQRAEHERERLLRLRTRMIQRWKRHWTAQRKKIEKQTETLQNDLSKLIAQQAVFESQRDETLLSLQDREERFHFREQQFEVEQAAWEVLKTEQQRQLDLQRFELEDRIERFERDKGIFRIEQKRLDRKTRHLRHEADGLEVRVKNLRKVLEELEARKASLGTIEPELPAILKLSNELPPGAIYIKSPPKPEEVLHEQRRQKLDALARTVADQQAVLVEQLDRMSIAKEFWRAEEKRVVEELERFTNELRHQDEALIQREDELDRRERRLIQEQESLLQMRHHLESSRTRLLLDESQFKGEQSRKRAEIHQAQRHAERMQQTYESLCHRWLTSRSDEEDRRQAAQKKLQELRERWLNDLAASQGERRKLEDRERQLAQQEMILELTRQSLAEKSDAKLFEKRIERFRRHVVSTFRRSEEKLLQQRETLETESASMREVFAVVSERLRTTNQREEMVRQQELRLLSDQTEHQLQVESTSDLTRRLQVEHESLTEEVQKLREELSRTLPITTEDQPLIRAA